MTEAPTIFAALSAVMEEVQAVGKGDRNDDQGYSFRGVDAVVNAVGPVLRRHKVIVMPVVSTAKYRDVQTSRGKPSRECTVSVIYRFYGPAGDHIDAEVPGEAMDFGDKGTAKAMSVAYRIALLQALCIPTHDPEPDASSYERDNQPPDPLMLAKRAVQSAYTARHGGWDQDKCAADFNAWSQGELLANAEASRLHEYANSLRGTT